MTAAAGLPAPASMTDESFRRFRELIRGTLGINITEAKRTMVQSRLARRLRALGLDSYEAYLDLLSSGDGAAELGHFFNAVTTNKTDFFREPFHFEFLRHTVLPRLVAGRGRFPLVRMWSAGCSSGEEPYTLAMVASEFARDGHPFRPLIIASDVSGAVLEKARLAVYREEQAAPVPPELRRRYLLRGRDRGPQRGMVRIVPALRAMVEFRRLNFMDPDYGLPEMDVVFCRNVIIYFDRPTQAAVLARICRHLRPGGYLFVGHSETLAGFSLPIEQVRPTVYRRV
jgi:chemotaxis protein methyltransferase CheR